MKTRKLGLLGTILAPTLVSLGVALAGLGVLLYLGFSAQLYRNLDAILETKTAGQIESIETFWLLEEKDKNARAEFAAFAREWVVDVNSIVQISDESGNLIASSRKIQLWPEKKLRAGQAATVPANYTDGKRVTLRVYVQDVPPDTSPGYRILVAEPLYAVDGAIANLGMVLAVSVPLVLLFLALTITVITRRALRPLGEIIDGMERVGAKNLGERFSVAGSPREIVALKKNFDLMLDRLDEAFTEQRAFIADLSHQIRTPLAIVKGQLETTLRRERSRDEYEETLQSGLEEIDAIARIIEKLLLLARFDSREITPSFRRFDLSEEVRGLADDFSPLAQARGLGVALFLEPVEVRADANMLRQVFVNLFDNAVKYAVPGTEIAVSVAPVGDCGRLSVRNFGPVIASADIPHLFERFRRFDRTGAPGVGLGLSIVDSIAIQHGARMEVSSDAVLGTEFAILFPPAAGNADI